MAKKINWTKIETAPFRVAIAECELIKSELLDKKTYYQEVLKYFPDITQRKVIHCMTRINSIDLMVADLDIRILDHKRKLDEHQRKTIQDRRRKNY